MRRAEADVPAQALYGRLARQPAWILRVLWGWFNPLSLALGVFPAMFIAAVFAELVVTWAASVVGPANYFDTWLAGQSNWNAVAVGFVFAYVGAILGVLGQRRAISRGGLQQALAARPPRLEGGAAECRLCGAPLFAEQERIGVACAYCGADNLLIVPTPWVKELAAETKRLLLETASARDAYRRERARVGRFVLWYVLGISLVSPLFLLAFRQTIVDRTPELSDWPPSYPLYRATPEPFVIEHRLVRRSGYLYPDARPWAAGTRCTSGPTSIVGTLEPELCDRGVCELRYYAALARGDRLELVAAGAPTAPRS